MLFLNRSVPLEVHVNEKNLRDVDTSHFRNIITTIVSGTETTQKIQKKRLTAHLIAPSSS